MPGSTNGWQRPSTGAPALSPLRSIAGTVEVRMASHINSHPQVPARQSNPSVAGDEATRAGESVATVDQPTEEPTPARHIFMHAIPHLWAGQTHAGLGAWAVWAPRVEYHEVWYHTESYCQYNNPESDGPFLKHLTSMAETRGHGAALLIPADDGIMRVCLIRRLQPGPTSGFALFHLSAC
jgi:hypothetical protein